jgi:hypothetical protein
MAVSGGGGWTTVDAWAFTEARTPFGNTCMFGNNYVSWDDLKANDITIGNSTDFTWSYYIKLGTADWVRRTYSGTTQSSGVTWMRVSLYLITGGTIYEKVETSAGTILQASLGSGSRDVWTTGWQVELKTYATPLDTINTDGATARVTQYLGYPPGTLVDKDQGSISLWFTPDWDYDDNQVSDPMLWSFVTDGTDRFLLYYEMTGNRFRVYQNDGTATILNTTASTHARGDRIFFTVTWDATTVYFYIDGIFMESGTKRDYTLTSPMIIGDYQTSLDGDRSCNGCIDELIFWKGKLLTAEEVQKLSELAVPNVIANPNKAVAAIVWPQDGGDDDPIYDQPATQGNLSDHTYAKLNGRNGIRVIT